MTEIPLEDPKFTLDQTIKKLSNYGNGLDQNAYYYLMLLRARIAKRDEKIKKMTDFLNTIFQDPEKYKLSATTYDKIMFFLEEITKPESPPPKKEKMAAEFRKAEKQLDEDDLKGRIEKAQAQLIEIFDRDWNGDMELIHDDLNILDDILAGRK